MRRTITMLTMLTLAACGSVNHSGSPDAAVGTGDAAAADAAPTTISITVYGDDNTGQPAGQLIPNIAVYFMAPDHSVQKVLTGPDGVATATAQANTTVLVARNPDPNSWRLVAYTGLAPGDSLVVGYVQPDAAPLAKLGDVKFTHGTFTGATRFTLITSCILGGSNVVDASTLSVTVTACGTMNAANIVSVASDQYNVPLAYAVLTDFDLPSHIGTTTALPAYTAAATVSGSFTNLSGMTGLTFQTVYTKGDEDTQFGYASTGGNVTTSSASFSTPIVPFGDHTDFSVDMFASAYARAVVYFARSAHQESSITLDASSMIHFAAASQFNPAVNTVSWSESVAGVDPNLVYAWVNWYHGGALVNYELYTPHGASSSVPLPPLPDELATTIGHTSADPDPIDLVGLNLFGVVGTDYRGALRALFGTGTPMFGLPTATTPFWYAAP